MNPAQWPVNAERGGQVKVGEANSAVSEIEPTAMRSAGTDSLVGLKEMSVPGKQARLRWRNFN